MKKFGKIVTAVLIFGLFVVLPAAAQKTQADFQKMYIDFLKKRGYEYKILDHGAVQFQIPEPTYDVEVTEDGSVEFMTGNTYFQIVVDENDPQRFTIITYIPLVLSSYDKNVEIAYKANEQIYGSKIVILDDADLAAVLFGNLVPKPKDFSLVFDGVMAEIKKAADIFLTESILANQGK